MKRARARWAGSQKWLRDGLTRTDTWLLIAILSLTGWTVDAVRFFLSMHDSLSVGFAVFASHFWFAVPVTVAVIALTRLQPRVRLLEAAVYDETGCEVHHAGDFPLTTRHAGALLGATLGGDRWLPALALPAGAQVYFLKEGSSTILLSFSGAASLAEVAAARKQVPHPPAGSLELLGGLGPEAALFATSFLYSPVQRRTFSFFSQQGRAAVPFDEVVGRVVGAEDEVRAAIQAFIETGLVECQTVCDLAFCRLTRDPARYALVQELDSWQAQWQERRRRLDYLVE